MKFDKKTKERVNELVHFIESLGGCKVSEAATGTVYCDLVPIKKIRIADHLSSKAKVDYLQIIIQKEKNRRKYICVFSRNIKIFNNIGRVKEWIEDFKFMTDVLMYNSITFNYLTDNKLEAMKKDILIKDQACKKYKKEIDKLNNFIEQQNNTIANIKEKYHNAVQYHNKWQEAASLANRLHKKVEKLLEKLHEQGISAE